MSTKSDDLRHSAAAEWTQGSGRVSGCRSQEGFANTGWRLILDGGASSTRVRSPAGSRPRATGRAARAKRSLSRPAAGPAVRLRRHADTTVGDGAQDRADTAGQHAWRNSPDMSLSYKYQLGKRHTGGIPVPDTSLSRASHGTQRMLPRLRDITGRASNSSCAAHCSTARSERRCASEGWRAGRARPRPLPGPRVQADDHLPTLARRSTRRSRQGCRGWSAGRPARRRHHGRGEDQERMRRDHRPKVP